MDLLLKRARATMLADAAFAATALHLAWRAAQSGSARPPLVIVSVVVLHVLMAGLLLWRRPERGARGALTWLPALPSLLLGGVVAGWPGLPMSELGALLFCAGSVGAAASMLALGRSFAVLPGARELVARGPYGLVRHPMYLSELVMFVALVLPLPAWQSVALISLVSVALMWRICAEERVLAALPEHARYVQRVRARLVPMVW